MNDKELYAWIAETSYLLHNSTILPISFHPVPATRDATTRINVQVGDKNRICVVSTRNQSIEDLIMSPRDVYEHFSPRDKEGKRNYAPTFVPTFCGRCGVHKDKHEVPGYRCP